MLAALLVANNAPLELHDVEPAGPLAHGQVFVRVLVAGICGAQLQEIRGEKGGPLPHLMGHEGCGIVEAIGPGVTRVRIGDKVVMHWRKAAGIESEFPKYQFAHGTHGTHGKENPGSDSSVSSVCSVGNPAFTSGLVTTWTTHSVCSENRLTPVPADTDPTVAALLGCSVSTALATVESEARWGERVLVIGAGGLGLALLGALEMVEPTRLCACDIMESKRDAVEHLGADFVTTLANCDPFDLIIDTAGAPVATEMAMERMAPSGRYVMVGQPAPGKPVCINAARHMFDGDGKTITATQGGGFRPDRDIPRYLKIASSIMFRRMVTHVFPLEKINAALDLVRAGEAGRVMIQMG